MRLLFICIGNICRSPMAAGLAQKMLEGQVQAESAGIAPFGGSAANEVIRMMRLEGVDLSGHRPRHVASVSLGDFDCVVSMDPYVHGYLEEPCREAGSKLISWDIDDPYGQDIDAYTRSLGAIRSHVKDLLEELGLPSGEER